MVSVIDYGKNIDDNDSLLINFINSPRFVKKAHSEQIRKHVVIQVSIILESGFFSE